MKKEILIATLCASLMFVTPITGIAKENKVTSNLSEHPDSIESLVAQIRYVIGEVLEKYGQIPSVRCLCNILLNLIWFPGKILFCIAITIITIPLGILTLIFLFLGIERLWQAFGILTFISINIYDRECNPYFPNPINSICSILKTKDTPVLSDCPCLQE